MSKREARKKEKQRRAMRPTRLSVILAVWIEPGSPIHVASLRHAFDSLKRQRFTRTIYRPTGPDQHCYTNVQEQIEVHGGDAVAGWIVLTNRSSRLDAGQNKFAKYCLEAHCLGGKDGELIEVADGGHMPFILDDKVQPSTNGNIFFCDDDACAKRLLRMPIVTNMTSRHIIARIENGFT